LNSKVTSLEAQVEALNIQLGKNHLRTTRNSKAINIAKKYEERVNEGVYLSQAYKLLGRL
jgi:hypothetical protein